MPEEGPGNGRLPENEQAAVAQPDTQRRKEMLAETEAFLAQRNVAPAPGQAPAQSARALLSQPPAKQAGPDRTPPPAAPSDDAETLLDDPSLQLLMRFLVGAAIVGAEELLSRVRHWDAQAPQPPIAASENAFDEATNLELARYLIIGSMVWGRKQLVRTARRNLIGSAGKPPILLESIDRALAIWPLRSLRDPVKQAAANLAATANQRVREGWREEQAARWLASKTIGEIIDDFIDHLSENPALAALVRDQLNEQSIGLATTVRDTGREWSATGDDVIEAVVRRIFRRPPRSKLPDSSSAVAQPGVEDGRDQ